MRNFNARAGVDIRETISDGMDTLRYSIAAAIDAAVRAGGEVIRQRAYENANVSPGILGNGVDGSHMRDNYKVEVLHQEHGSQAKIGIDLSIIPYAPHQEFGPHGNAPLRRAIDETRSEVHAKMRDVFRETLGPGESVRFGTAVRFRRFA